MTIVAQEYTRKVVNMLFDEETRYWQNEYREGNIDNGRPGASYKSCFGICANCGREGGDHFTNRETKISWCYSLTDRRAYRSPEYHTSFAYGKPKMVDMVVENIKDPNLAFKLTRRVEDYKNPCVENYKNPCGEILAEEPVESLWPEEEWDGLLTEDDDGLLGEIDI